MPSDKNKRPSTKRKSAANKATAAEVTIDAPINLPAVQESILSEVLRKAESRSIFDEEDTNLRKREARRDEAEDKSEEKRPAYDPNAKWQPVPCTMEQRARYPETVRRRPRTVKVFDLSDPEQLKEYNQIYERFDAIQPLVDVLHEERVVFEGNWRVLIHYADLEFQKL